MTMKPFAHANASSLEQALETLDATCRPLAGGTDLLGLMKDDLAAPERLVNIKTISGLDEIETDTQGVHIGALTTLSQLAVAPEISDAKALACLYESILASATPQLRHMATIGGNLLQEPRCWYYRNHLTHCWRKGGQRCFAFRGQNRNHVILEGGPCFAVHPSDPAVALLALDASVAVRDPEGERMLTLEQLYRRPNRDDRSDTVLGDAALITALTIPAPRENTRSVYVKQADRGAWNFALVSVAVVLTMADGVVDRARVGLGGVANIPWRATGVEQALEGQRLSEEVIASAAEAASEGARPLEHNAYKIDLLQGAIRETLRRFKS